MRLPIPSGIQRELDAIALKHGGIPPKVGLAIHRIVELLESTPEQNELRMQIYYARMDTRIEDIPEEMEECEYTESSTDAPGWVRGDQKQGQQ